jgi:hypothetical protein
MVSICEHGKDKFRCKICKLARIEFLIESAPAARLTQPGLELLGAAGLVSSSYKSLVSVSTTRTSLDVKYASMLGLSFY